MFLALAASNIYSALAISVLVLHALFILWVTFGALLTRGRALVFAEGTSAALFGDPLRNSSRSRVL